MDTAKQFNPINIWHADIECLKEFYFFALYGCYFADSRGKSNCTNSIVDINYFPSQFGLQIETINHISIGQ